MMANPAQLRSEATQRYRPAQVHVLFVAESPPAAPDRHFYFPDVTRADTLWIELMRALYPSDFGETKAERKRKAEWLRRFQADGYWLIEALPVPIDKQRKERQIRDNAASVINEIQVAGPDNVVLIAASVWQALRDPVIQAGFNLRQMQAIPFPGQGQQRKFREAMQVALEAIHKPDA